MEFENDVPCLRNRPNQHDDGGIIDPLATPFPHSIIQEKEVQNILESKNFYFVGTYGNHVFYSRFSEWLREYVHNGVNVMDAVNVQFLHVISWGPDHRVRIIEFEYVVYWPKKKLVIYQCKWYDTDSSGTKVHPQYKIVEINHTRQHHFYDSFIIEQNVKQVYYIPYPLCKNKSSWHVVIKTKPIGRVEVEDALDVAFQK
ncbi:hypothetical protein RDI58_013361 [Solanum bulbocastanum]|uniref:DUF4216 domain-containing protein n=1 Tax=Solanum bulbocastanum TaxID=147425 RepID=A0AAN8TTG3_SOLBU